MEHHVSGITHFVNHYLGQFALAILAALHIHPSDPELPIPEHVVMACVVLVLVTLLHFYCVRDSPSKNQAPCSKLPKYC